MPSTHGILAGRLRNVPPAFYPASHTVVGDVIGDEEGWYAPQKRFAPKSVTSMPVYLIIAHITRLYQSH